MKHTAMLLLLLATSLAFANPVWTEDVVVREAQDLSYTGCTQQADDGSLITLWTQILDGENCLIANRISAVGEEMWDSPLRIAGCGLGIGGEQMVRCSDDNYLLLAGSTGIQPREADGKQDRPAGKPALD